MKLVTSLALVLTFLIGIGAFQEVSATELTFWLNAWNDDEQPEWVAADGITFRIVFYDQFDVQVGDPVFMNHAGGGALYWRYIDSDEMTVLGGDWFGAVSWSVEFTDGNWDLIDPLDPFQFVGDINFAGNNVCNPEDWFFSPANGR